MTKSLQDQLLKAGLVDNKKAKQISKENRKAKKQKIKNKDNSLNESQAAVQEAQQEKQKRDRELNLKLKQDADEKALSAQVKQLVEHYKVKREKSEIEYNFKDGTTIKRILVSPQISEELAKGRLCVARCGEAYEVVPKPIADRIRERDDSFVLVYNFESKGEQDSSSDSDADYYSQFEIPDDLMW